MIPISAEPDSKPRLRTAYWFLLTAMCALVAVVRVGWTERLDVLPQYRPFVTVTNFAVALIMGAAVTGLVIIVARRLRGADSWSAAPGHFLLGYISAGYLLMGEVELVLAAIPGLPPVGGVLTEYELYYAGLLVKALGAGTLSLIVAWLIRGNLWWKSVPLALGVAVLIHAPFFYHAFRGNSIPWLDQSTHVAQIALGGILPALLLLAIRIDRRGQLARDWLHWLGVSLMVAGALGGAVEGVYFLNA